jgi:hypothetical protein
MMLSCAAGAYKPLGWPLLAVLQLPRDVGSWPMCGFLLYLGLDTSTTVAVGQAHTSQTSCCSRHCAWQAWQGPA